MADAGWGTLPAVVRRGDLLIAISTSGRSPALAGHLRRELELLVLDDWEVLVRLLGAARTRVQRAVGDADRRRHLLERLVSLDLLSTLRHDGRPGRDGPDRRPHQRDGSDCSSASSSCAKRRRNSDSVSTA